VACFGSCSRTCSKPVKINKSARGYGCTIKKAELVAGFFDADEGVGILKNGKPGHVAILHIVNFYFAGSDCWNGFRVISKNSLRERVAGLAMTHVLTQNEYKLFDAI
jgi:hypothetical protein